MSEVVHRAAFLRDVKVGDRFQFSVLPDGPPWLVTGRELVKVRDFVTGQEVEQVVLIGQDDDGEPKTTTAAPWATVIIYVPVDAPAEPTP